MVIGEFPGPIHPVVWMGTVLNVLLAYAPRAEAARFGFGLVAAVGLPLAWGALGAWLERRTTWPIQALLLKPTFAGRALLVAAREVEGSMSQGQLQVARRHLRSLVSRPTDHLDEALISSAAIESLAENYVDSWVAPLAAYCLFGLGGAYAYRAVNTADAMWGYHTAAFQWLGKASARLDDACNWFPARIGALLLAITGSRYQVAFRIWRRDATVTESPNAGQPMSVAAGQLGVWLEKPGHYRLYPEARPPSAVDIVRARRLVARAMLLAACLSIVVRRMAVL